jgi:hypothetical protein
LTPISDCYPKTNFGCDQHHAPRPNPRFHVWRDANNRLLATPCPTYDDPDYWRSQDRQEHLEPSEAAAKLALAIVLAEFLKRRAA